LFDNAVCWVRKSNEIAYDHEGDLEGGYRRKLKGAIPIQKHPEIVIQIHTGSFSNMPLKRYWHSDLLGEIAIQEEIGTVSLLQIKSEYIMNTF
jgi:hypothetical protein